MNEILEDKLLKRFSKLFPEGKNVDKKKSLMYFGFAVGDGWFDILWNAFIKTEEALKKSYELFKPSIEFIQVKEKFSTLRVYYNVNGSKEVSDEIHGIFIDAEHESSFTCEVCGSKRGKRTGKMWIKTLCKECEGKQNEL